MSEQAPKPADTNEAATNPEKNVDHEIGLLERAHKIINAKKEGLDSAAKEESDAIDAKLKELVESGQITQEGADNRRAQLDRIVGYAAADVPKAPEYSRLSEEDHAYLVGQVADQIDKIRMIDDDEKHESELERLKASLMADNSGISAEEADKLIDEAWAEDERRDTERYGEKDDEFEGEGTKESPRRRKAPEGLPTTEELEQNEGKLSWKAKARRLIGLPNVYIGIGMAKTLDFMNGRRENYNKKIERREDETDEAYEKRMRKYGRRATLATVAIGAVYIGARTHAFGLLEHHGGSGSASSIADHKDNGNPDAAHYTEVPTEFDYNHDADPFYSTDKLGVHNYGGPLDADPADIKGVAGSHELTENWKHNSGQLSVAAAEMGLPGFSDADTDPAHFGLENADSMADQLQSNTEKHQQTYDQLVAILNKPTTTSHEIKLEPGTYGSYYQSEIDGKLVNAYDPSVNEPGTAIVYNYQLDDGSWHEVIIKKDCGGQVVHMNPVEQPAAVAAPVESAPVQQYEQPQAQGGGNPETQPPVTSPPETQPPVTNPPETQPPVTQPPETEPPVTQPPETEPPVTEPPVTQPPEELAHKTDHTPTYDGAPPADSDPLEAPAQTETGPLYTEQEPGQATTPDQTGGTVDDSTVGTGGSRTETGAGDTGPAAVDSDLNQSNESANNNAVDSTPGSTGTPDKPATGDAGSPF